MLLGSALAQEPQLPGAQSAQLPGAGLSEAQVAAQAIEEVIVTGQRPLRSLLQEGQQLTEDFYMRLNEVLDDDNFEITCDNERRTGSNFVDRVCTTGFQQRIARRQAQSTLQSLQAMQSALQMQQAQGGADGVALPVIPELDYAELLSWQSQFEEAILNAVNTDPVLNRQVVQLMALKSAVDNYQTPRAQRREERQADREAGAAVSEGN